MLNINQITKVYGDNVVLDQVGFTINHGDRLGLIGPNGCGKTTLLRIIMGQIAPDDGLVTPTAPGVRIGYLEQSFTCAAEATVGEMLLTQVNRAEDEIERLAMQMTQASGEALEDLMEAYTRALDRLQAGGGYAVESQMDAILAGLGLDCFDRDTPVRILSGGQKTRLGLARLLLERPNVLLLDEPTNHLDIDALEWLEEFLGRYDGAALIVSHDRAFLDHTINTILEIDPVEHSVRAYPGNYTAYIEAKEREYAHLWAKYKDQQDRIAQYTKAITGFERYARNIEHGTINFAIRKIAKGIARKAVVQKRRLERYIESEEMVDKPKRSWQMKLDFVDTPPGSQDALIIDQLAMGFGERLLFEGVELTLHAGERVVLTGANGSGKTTLLRIIMGQYTPWAGHVRVGPSVQVGYYSQEQEGLDDDADAFTEIRRVAALGDTETRNFLHYFLFSGDEVFMPIGSLSYGQRARLALAKLVAAGCNLLILDEPINHLDIPSRERFEQGLRQFSGAVLAVVHDRYFIQRFATRIWAVHDRGIHQYIDLEDMHRVMTGVRPESWPDR